MILSLRNISLEVNLAAFSSLFLKSIKNSLFTVSYPTAVSQILVCFSKRSVPSLCALVSSVVCVTINQ